MADRTQTLIDLSHIVDDRGMGIFPVRDYARNND